MYPFAETTITKYHTLGGFNNRNGLSYRSGDQKSDSKVAGGLLLSEGCEGGSVPGLSPGLAAGCLLPVSPCHLPLCESGCPNSLFLQGQPSHWVRANTNDII